MVDFFIKGKPNYSCVVTDNDEIIGEHVNTSKNITEWLSLYRAITKYSGISLEDDICAIYTDSLLLYKQVKHKVKIKNKNIRSIYLDYIQCVNSLSGHSISVNYISGCNNPAREAIY